ncbi:ABC transporter ATP-binding protein [Bradyrhizobium liaoningense]|uniref:ABC transporter ATP-binding protein n=1 Tax=Bradyrhizobium liaoningense TaxID=43992 RepID=UPI001BA70D67|nr:ABC transporter ATP-binding protein [Bradyrhizobium liaoningense]MBR0843872.1 ABC transporter ATP-binding protein [Bradyrhizobium liaoningense]
MSDKNWTIRAEGLSKKFGLSLRRSMAHGLRDSLARLAGADAEPSRLREGEFWAVKDVAFTLERGQSLGIMGVNGCGKTTLLRILNGIYKPDAGRAMLRGRVGALIAAGAGFSPMLTARENIYINGALLGLTPREIRARMDEIIAFAELEQFVDMPVKHYSSGMQVRLGFSVAAVSEPDVLLVDEVLAVGDLNFQKKCYDYLFGLKRKGTSIVLVSHSIGAIWAVCDHGLFMDKGEAKVLGRVEDVIRAYDEKNAQNSLASAHATAKAAEHGRHENSLAAEYGHVTGGTGEARVTALRVKGAAGSECPEFGFGEPITFELDLQVLKPLEGAILRLTVDAIHYKYVCVVDSLEQGIEPLSLRPGQQTVTIEVPRQNLRPGGYVVNCAIVQRHAGVHIFYWFGCTRFQVSHPRDRLLYADDNAVLHLDAQFKFKSDTTGERSTQMEDNSNALAAT